MDCQTLHHVPVNMRLKSDSQCLTLTIIFHPDISRIGEQSLHKKVSFDISRVLPLFGNKNSQQNKSYHRPLGDQYLSRTPLKMIPSGTNWLLEKDHSTTELSTLEQDSINSLELSEPMLQQGCLVTLAGRIVLLFHYSRHINDHLPDYGLIGVSDNLAKIRSLISRVAGLKALVLVRGESGTGKELVALALHRDSPRNNRKLISVNMAAIPTDLIATELFGSVKGAFTGAVTRNGCFQQANGSSLFLDEIGEAPAGVQVALLRALETGVVQPVGSEKEQQLEVRVIAATDADLEDLISQESFRMPLLQRLSGLVIDILPLRNRVEDIGVILSKFLMAALEETDQLDKLVDADDNRYYYWAWFYAQCCALHWPGNVRQIKNTVSQLSILLMGHDDVSTFDWLSFIGRIEPTSTEQSQPVLMAKQQADTPELAIKRKPREISDREIVDTLEQNHWQIKLTADQLHISRAALYIRMDANPNIRRAGNLSSSEINAAFTAFSGNLDEMVYDLKVSKPALKRRLNEIGLSY